MRRKNPLLIKLHYIYCITHQKIEFMGTLTLETVQHSKLTDIDEIEPINDNDFTVLEELRAVLAKHDYTERFGVVLLHKHFDVSQDEVLMETTNDQTRTSIVKVEKASEIKKDDTIQTMWKFGRNHEIKAVTECVLVCQKFFGHNLKHKKVGK